jgi:hypothetical protein
MSIKKINTWISKMNMRKSFYIQQTKVFVRNLGTIALKAFINFTINFEEYKRKIMPYGKKRKISTV